MKIIILISLVLISFNTIKAQDPAKKKVTKDQKSTKTQGRGITETGVSVKSSTIKSKDKSSQSSIINSENKKPEETIKKDKKPE